MTRPYDDPHAFTGVPVGVVHGIRTVTAHDSFSVERSRSAAQAAALSADGTGDGDAGQWPSLVADEDLAPGGPEEGTSVVPNESKE